MTVRSEDYEILIVWKGKGRFQWRLINGEAVLHQGEERTVDLARATGQAFLKDLRVRVKPRLVK